VRLIAEVRALNLLRFCPLCTAADGRVSVTEERVRALSHGSSALVQVELCGRLGDEIDQAAW
jgi:hypothetical protein